MELDPARISVYSCVSEDTSERYHFAAAGPSYIFDPSFTGTVSGYDTNIEINTDLPDADSWG